MYVRERSRLTGGFQFWGKRDSRVRVNSLEYPLGF